MGAGQFSSLQEDIDTTSAGGRFYLYILAALAEFERDKILILCLTIPKDTT